MRCETPEQLEDFTEVALRNLIQIEANLRRLGYIFANPHGAIQLASGDINSGLKKIKRDFAHLPGFFSAWYGRVACVDFSQHITQLLEPSDDPVAGLGLNCTLVFGSIETASERRQQLEQNGFTCNRLDGKTFFPFGTFASNSTPKGVWLPDSTLDPEIYDAGAGPVTMSAEIICAVMAGGFPFWENMFAKRRITSPIPNTPRFRVLLPLLKEGIVPM